MEVILPNTIQVQLNFIGKTRLYVRHEVKFENKSK